MTDIYAPERRLKAALQDAHEVAYLNIVCQYLREVLDGIIDEFPEAGLAKKLVALIEATVEGDAS